MIDQHYGHVKPEMFAAELSGITFDTEKQKPLIALAIQITERKKGLNLKHYKECEDEIRKRGCI